MSRSQANLLLLMVAVLWGSAFVAQAHGTAGLGTFAFTGIRFLVGTCIVAPLAWRDYQMVMRRVSPPTRHDGLGVLGLGLLLMFGAAFQQLGIEFGSTVTNAGFLTALYVPLVPILTWAFMQARPHWSVWPTSLGCVVGTWMLSGAGQLEISSSDLWVVASSLFWALHVVLVGRIAERLAAPFLVAFGQFFVCGAVCLGWAGMTESMTFSSISQAAWPIVYTGVLSVGVAYTGQIIGQRYTPASDAAIILSAETLFAALFGYLLMGDRLSAMGVAGGTLIFACILVVQVMPMLAASRFRPRTE